jgi:hypothetical protein
MNTVILEIAAQDAQAAMQIALGISNFQVDQNFPPVLISPGKFIVRGLATGLIQQSDVSLFNDIEVQPFGPPQY